MGARTRSRNPTKLRYAPEASYPRGEETRQRLIHAAITLFGMHGFEAASTRDIASAASLNTPALQYYFDNKEGLYAACAEHIVAQGWKAMRDVVVAAERLLRGGADDSALIEAFCSVQERIADGLPGASGDWLLWLAREQTVPAGGATHLMNHRISRRMILVGRSIVARLAGRPRRDPESLVHAMALSGQLLRFYLMPGHTRAVLGWKRMDGAALTMIKRVVRQQSAAALRAIVAERVAAEAPRRVARRRAQRSA